MVSLFNWGAASHHAGLYLVSAMAENKWMRPLIPQNAEESRSARTFTGNGYAKERARRKNR